MERAEKRALVQRREAMEREVAELRGDLGLIVHEIERRVRQAMSIREQANRHPLIIAALAAGLASVTTLLIVQAAQRRREQAGRSRIANLRLALRHLAYHPEDVLDRKKPASKGMLMGIGKSAGSFGAKQLARKLLMG